MRYQKPSQNREVFMCGRFVGYRSFHELQTAFPIDKAVCDVTENYNVAPSQEVLAIIKHDKENWLERLHWGLVPFWARDVTIGSRMINARAETVATKPSFRGAFRKRRCLILADGFYEWKGSKGEKQPMFITLPEGGPFAFAGLWETWSRKDDPDSVYKSCAIVTLPASSSVREIHHRMPAILKPENYAPWLDPSNQDVNELTHILKTGIVRELKSQAVSMSVNSVKNNEPSNIIPLPGF
jgi:putative SOS response-associated peptidase YedK